MYFFDLGCFLIFYKNSKVFCRTHVFEFLQAKPCIIIEDFFFKEHFVMSVGNNFLSQTVSFGIFRGIGSFLTCKKNCLDPSKQPWALANLWMLASLASLASQTQIANLRLHLRSAFGFFNLAWLNKQGSRHSRPKAPETSPEKLERISKEL